MSDRPLADDWWLASDGKWYPPQSRTEPLPPPPATASVPAPAPPQPYGTDLPRQQPYGPARRTVSSGLTGTLMGFQIAAGGLFTLAGLMYFVTWLLWTDFRDGGSTTFGDVLDMAESGDGFAALAVLLGIVVFVLIIIWLNISYKAAMTRGATENRWSPGWAVGGWFIPFANFVIPKLVVNEVDRMSRLELTEPIGSTWKPLKRTAISDWWWALQVGGLVVANTSDTFMVEAGNDLGLLLTSSFGYTVAGVGFILGGFTVRSIGGRLRQ